MSINFFDKVLWWKQSGRDKYGGIKYDDPVEVDCRVEEITKRVVDRQGDFYISQYRVFFKDNIDVAIGDKLTIDFIDHIVNEVHIEKDYYGNIILKWVLVKEI